MITRAIVYLRQSRDVEGTRAAVDRQLEDCERLCDRMGWTIVRTHTDNDVSASSKKARPGYDALFADVRVGACDVVSPGRRTGCCATSARAKTSSTWWRSTASGSPPCRAVTTTSPAPTAGCMSG